ncbi:SAM-dependent methyltransferase [Kitasatospora purpeofusca]|uniref:SAM-dependent methyltransferase n=1 Tax=Kitasatospora purpeofusca TaxID=67352 RepID=UPI0022567B38|nr:SAM-dependent methyltransferase [Kitasatospora purpeofusca]MCX4752203.1 SAM-dependent methyltransferase [Kitasatospora purpeofusca]WSR31794.1 SAM-dependent methyltransferase [Kitasatospora purpeofusca]WSR39821.1 SAM-dependent methyltransferase [Kitasatospora purpeofusca]
MTGFQEIGREWLTGDGEGGARPPADLRPEVPHPARMYDYYIGGKDNFPADREAAERVLAISPMVRISALANRAFLGRAVRHLAEDGIRRFVDIGTGIPSAGNTHEVAQRVRPDARVVYLDNDPIVLVHGRALLSGTTPESTAVVQADLRDPAGILAAPEVRQALDAGEPVGLLLVAVLHFVDEQDDPYGIVRTLVDALPPGSRLVLSHGTLDFTATADAGRGPAVYRNASARLTMRGREQVQRFFDGLKLTDPGLVTAPLWRPDAPVQPSDSQVGIWAGVAEKP